MDAGLLCKLGLRFLAVYLIATGLSDVPIYLGFIYDAARPDSSASANWPFYLTGILSPFVVGAVLWFLAPYIAKSMAGKGGDTAQPVSVDAATFQAVGFTVLGVYFVAVNLPPFVSLLIDYIGHGPETDAFRASGQTQIIDSRLYTAAARTLFGVALVLGSGFFTELFRRFREFGLAGKS